MGKAGKLST